MTPNRTFVTIKGSYMHSRFVQRGSEWVWVWESWGEGHWWERRWLTTTVIAHIVTLLFARPASREVSGHLGTTQMIRVLF